MMLTNAVMRTDAWKAKVTELSAMAQAKLDATMHPSIQMATAICLQGMIDIGTDGTCRVLSSDQQRWYVTNGACACEAYHFAKGPVRMCKHLLGKRLATKAAELCTAEAQDVPTDPDTTLRAVPDPRRKFDVPSDLKTSGPEKVHHRDPGQGFYPVRGLARLGP